MADVSIGQYFISLFTKVDEKGAKQAVNTLDTIGDRIDTVAKAAVAAFTTGAFATAIMNVADRFDALGDTVSRMSGITAHQLSQIGYAASLAGSDVQTATASMESLSNTLGQAINGVGRGAQAFAAFGIEVRNADGSAKSVPQVLDDIRAKLAEMGTTAERTAMLQRLGIDPSLLEYLTLESDQLAQLNEEYEARSKLLIFDGLQNEDGSQVQIGDDVEQAIANVSGDFNDAKDRMLRGISDISTAFLVRLMPPLTAAFNRISQWFLDNSGKITTFFDPIASALGAIIDVIATVVTGLMDFNAALDGLPGIISAVLAAWKLLNVGFMATPIGMLITGITTIITALALLWDDFQVWSRGGESFFDWGPVVDTINSIIDAVQSLWQIMEDNGVIDAVIQQFQSIWTVVQGVFNGIVSFVKTAMGIIIGIFTGDWNMAAEGMTKLREACAQILNGIIGIFKSWGKILIGVVGSVWDSITSNFDSFTDFAKSLAFAIMRIPLNILSGIARLIGADSLVRLFDNALALLQNAFNNAIAGVTGLFSSGFDAVSRVWDNLPSVFGGIADGALGIVDSLLGTLSGAVDTAISSLQGAWQSFKDWLGGLFEGLDPASMLASFAQGVLDFLSNLVSQVLALGQEMLASFLEPLAKIGSTVKDFASGAWDKVKSFLPFGGDDEESDDNGEASFDPAAPAADTPANVSPAQAPGQAPAPSAPAIDYSVNAPTQPQDMVAPSTVNNTRSVTNNSTVTNNQTFNVNSREDAAYISQQTMRRQPGRAY